MVCILSKKGYGRFKKNIYLYLGWLYTIWAGLVLLSGLFTIFVWWKGGQWREEAEAREAEHAQRFDLGSPSNTV